MGVLMLKREGDRIRRQYRRSRSPQFLLGAAALATVAVGTLAGWVWAMQVATARSLFNPLPCDYRREVCWLLDNVHFCPTNGGHFPLFHPTMNVGPPVFGGREA